MNKDHLKKGCSEMILQLARLVDSGHTLNRQEFHAMCGEGDFIGQFITRYGKELSLRYLLPGSPLCTPEALDYFNDGMDRHTNAYVMEDYGLHANALLWGMVIADAIKVEVSE